MEHQKAVYRSSRILQHLQSDEKVGVEGNVQNKPCSAQKAPYVPKKVKIIGLGRYLPETIITSEQLEKEHGWKAGSVFAKTGIKERRRAKPEESSTWIGAQAAKLAIEDAGIKSSDIDLIINASGTPDRAIPDNAPIIQKHLGLGGQVPCFSVHATCVSALVALNVAAHLIEAGTYKTILIVSADVSRPTSLNWSDPHSASLIGDAGAAIVITKAPTGEDSAIINYHQKTWGDLCELTTLKGGGSYRDPHGPFTTPEDNLFTMQGPPVLQWAMDNLGEFMETFHEGMSQGLGPYEWWIPHQASENGINGASIMLNYDLSKTVRTLTFMGNTIASSVPSALYELVKSGKIKRGTKLLLIGTGAGLSMVAVGLVW